MREHNDAVNRLDVIPACAEIRVDYPAGTATEVRQHDGSVLRLHKLETDYNPTDRIQALNYIQRHEAKGEVVTGLLFVDPDADDLHQHLHTVATPLNRLGEAELCPGAALLEKINASLR